MAATELRGLDRFGGTIVEGTDAELPSHEVIALTGDPRRIVRHSASFARRASRLKIFLDEPVWVLPGLVPAQLRALVHGDLPPALIETIATQYRRREVRDDWMRRQLTPNRPPTRATTARSKRWYRTLRRRDVELITWPIANVVTEGIRTADGIEHRVDAIVVV